MVPSKQEVIHDAAVISKALLAGIPGLEGSGHGVRWEGQTDRDMRVWVAHRDGNPGLSVWWSYMDDQGEGHQHRQDLITLKSLPALVQAMVSHVGIAFPRRFLQDPARVQDPAVLAAHRMLHSLDQEAFEPEPAQIDTPEPDRAEENHQADLMERKLGIEPLPDGEAEDEATGVDPALNQYPFQFQHTEENTGDVDPNVEHPESPGEAEGLDGGGVVSE